MYKYEIMLEKIENALSSHPVIALVVIFLGLCLLTALFPN